MDEPCYTPMNCARAVMSQLDIDPTKVVTCVEGCQHPAAEWLEALFMACATEAIDRAGLLDDILTH